MYVPRRASRCAILRCPSFGECVRQWENPCTTCEDSTSWTKHNNDNVDCEKVAEDPHDLCDKVDASGVPARAGVLPS